MANKKEIKAKAREIYASESRQKVAGGMFAFWLMIALVISPSIWAATMAHFGRQAGLSGGSAAIAWIILWILTAWFSLKKAGYYMKITDFKEYLPEAVAKELRIKVEKDFPQLIVETENLIREAEAKDDPGELNKKLERLKLLAEKKQSLSQMPGWMEKLKTEIAALEKELGIK